jgi:serine/threonine protein kinase
MVLVEQWEMIIAEWKGVDWKKKFRKQPYNLLRKKFPAASFTGAPVLSELGFDLLNRLLTFDPEQRLTVDEALSHGWFNEVPLQKSKEFMPTFPPKRNWEISSKLIWYLWGPGKSLVVSCIFFILFTLWFLTRWDFEPRGDRELGDRCAAGSVDEG